MNTEHWLDGRTATLICCRAATLLPAASLPAQPQPHECSGKQKNTDKTEEGNVGCGPGKARGRVTLQFRRRPAVNGGRNLIAGLGFLGLLLFNYSVTAQTADETNRETYRVSGGQIEVKARLKYEIIL